MQNVSKDFQSYEFLMTKMYKISQLSSCS